MHAYPHHYAVKARAESSGDVSLTSAGLPTLASAPPLEFDGPGDRWSPETLLVAAVADCFILTFRSVARASKLPWSAIECSVKGVLDRVEKIAQFSRFTLSVELQVPADVSDDDAAAALIRSEKHCLISNSLKGEKELVFSIVRK